MGSILGGSAPSSQQVYQPANTSTFDTNYGTLIENAINNNPYGAYGSTAANIFNSTMTNPYASPYVAAAGNAGTVLNTTGQQASAASPQINAAGMSLIPATGQVLNTAFDPQQALKNQTQQQVVDQANVTSAQSGTTGSPYGASVTDTANQNFNIDWQAQQLQKQIAGLNAADSGVATAGNAATTAANVGATGAQDIANAGALPYQAQQNVTGDQSAALQSLLSILGNSGSGAWNSSTLSALMSYLGLGANQSNVQAGLNQQAQQAADSGIGGLLGSLMSAGTSLINGPSSLINLG